MGKVEDMRLLRQQIREMEQAPSGSTGRRKVAPAIQPAPPAGEELCGHTAISGKRCIRPAGHSEKNHRYAKSV